MKTNEDSPNGCPGPEILSACIDGVLDPAEREDLERHVVQCFDCREVIAETVEANNIQKAKEKAEAKTKERNRFWIVWLMFAIAAAGIVISYLGKHHHLFLK